MITEIKGDLLKQDFNFIAHQVNCQKVMGSGLALQIKNKYPIVFDRYKTFPINGENPLGQSQFIKVEENKYVVNMFAQYFYGVDKRQTNYEAFYSCLEQIKNTINKKDTIGFPKFIGCDRGGGNWNIIYTMIKEVLWEYNVFIVEYNN